MPILRCLMSPVSKEYVLVRHVNSLIVMTSSLSLHLCRSLRLLFRKSSRNNVSPGKYIECFHPIRLTFASTVNRTAKRRSDKSFDATRLKVIRRKGSMQFTSKLNDPGTFKLDHLQPVKLILFQNFSTLFIQPPIINHFFIVQREEGGRQQG